VKVILINRFFFPDHSATSQLLTDLASHLAKAGRSVQIIASRQFYDTREAILPSSDNLQGVRVTRVRTTRFGRYNLMGRTVDYLTFYLSAAWSLFVLLRPGDIVVAKTDPPLISVVAATVAKMRGARLINWIQDLFPEVAGALCVGGTGWIHEALRRFRNWSLRSARYNIAVGERMANKLISEGVPLESIGVIQNWADGQAIGPVDRENNELRRAWKLQDSFVVGYSGNLGRAHEFETVVKAAQKLQRTSRIVFLFIGGGAQREWIAEEVRRRGLNNVMFKPYQPRELLSVSLSVPDIHFISLHPQLEGLIVPSKFYGIAAAGRPIIFIGNKDGEIPRIIRDAQCGYAVEKGQVEEVVQIITQLAEHTERCLSLGIRARALFDQRFDRHHAMRAWEAVIAATVS
jgi:glycosyltransferase involved in cell wall biosynthesis